MTLTPELRKFVLTAHVVVSVGWIGIVVGFLALAIAGLESPDPNLVRASYVAMDFTYRTVVIPLGFASLITGAISSLGTEWGLVRHYWVLLKLLLTISAVYLMVVHLRPVSDAARAASIVSHEDFVGLKILLAVYASVALFVLIVATVLSTYKPRGRTPFGARKLAR